MAAVAADCRKALVNARWSIFLLSCTNGPRKHFFRLVGAPFLTFKPAFSLEECSLVRGTLTIERLLTVGVVKVMNLRSKGRLAQVFWANSQQKWKYR